MVYPGNVHSPPWDDGAKKRKTSGVGNSAAGRRATAAAEEAERYNQVAGHYLAPPPPAADTVIASNPFDDSHRSQHSRVPPRQLPAGPARAPPPEYPYGFAPRTAPALEPPARVQTRQGRASGAEPKPRGQPPPYPGEPGPVINTKSRMLMGGGNVNVQHPPQCGPGVPPLAALACEARPGAGGAAMPPGPAACKPPRKRKVGAAPPPAQPYRPPVDWDREGQAHFQPAMSRLDPCYMGGLPYSSAILRGQLALPAAGARAPEEPGPRSPQLLDECAGCRELVCSSEEPIWCRAGCGLVYHRRCTNLHETAHYLMTNTPNVAWMCQACEANAPDIEWIKSG